MPTWTDEEIAAVRAAVAKGVTTVRFGDREVTYASLTDLRALLAEMERANTGASAYRLAAFSKGA